MINWKEIKQNIISETKDVFSNETVVNVDLEKTIGIFFKILSFEVPESELKGIEKRIPNALHKVFIENIERIDKNSYFAELTKIEQYLKKIIYLTNKNSYKQIITAKSGLAKCISSLNLNPNNIDYNWETIPNYKKSYFSEHLIKTYNLRNTESHNLKEWNNVKLFENLQSVLVIYLYATHSQLDKLIEVIDKSIYSINNNYFETLKSNFEKWKKRFVHIRGKENFEEIQLYAIETEWQESSKNKLNKKHKEGKVIDLIGQLQQERKNQMIVVGDAGIGKTTTMQYLTYNYANNKKKLPIYIELKLLTPNFTIIDSIIKKLGINKTDFIKIINTNETIVFLDGLNEILPTIKNQIYVEIENIIIDYPQLFILLSTRHQDYHNEFSSIPVFSLQKMEIAQIRDFIDKNSNDKNIKKQIITSIETNNNWLDILGTPLILFMLINIVKRNKTIPDDENKIIIQFIQNIYNREKEKDFSFNTDFFHSTICHLAFESIEQIGNTNSGISLTEIHSIVDKPVKLNHLSRMKVSRVKQVFKIDSFVG
ncbi:MAG: hypothetical protein L3J45_06120 [Flavobacteriaceae bacterium]|nr:hypothetical protein [Flavobacteriaceae bacterium]